jgi:hypothetical protein
MRATAFLLALLPLAANAGTVAVTTTTAAGTTTSSITVSDADLARIVTANRVYFTRRPGAGSLTDQAVVAKIVSDAFRRASMRTQGYEREQAARAAKVAPIVTSP